MRCLYKSFEDLPVMLRAEDVAEVLGIARGNAYALMRRKDFPTICLGKRMMVPRDKLLEWIDQQDPKAQLGAGTPMNS